MKSIKFLGLFFVSLVFLFGNGVFAADPVAKAQQFNGTNSDDNVISSVELSSVPDVCVQICVTDNPALVLTDVFEINSQPVNYIHQGVITSNTTGSGLMPKQLKLPIAYWCRAFTWY